MSYVNGKPVGLTYSSSTNKPVGLTELSSIAVTLVSATNFSGITLSSLAGIDFTGLDDNYVLTWDAAGGTWQVEPQSGGGGGSGNSFTTFNVPLGTDPVADSGADTINFATTSNKVTITGNSTTDTIDFDVNEAAFSDPRDAGSSLADILDTVEGNISTNATNLSNHTGNASIHFTVASIDHGSIAGLGDNDHPQYASSSLSATVANIQTSTLNLSAYISSNEAAWTAGGANSLSSLDDVQVTSTPITGQVLSWDGSNWIAQTNSVGVTDHGLLTGLLDPNDHPQYASSSLSATVSSIQASTVSLSAYIAANESSWTSTGAPTFLGLTDTPSTYSPYANSFVVVNTDGDGLTFTPPTANAVIIGDQTGSPESLEVGQLLRTTRLGNSTNITTYYYSGAASGKYVEKERPDGTLMTYELGTSSFNLSSPADWWTVVAPTFNHNTLNGLTVGNPHTQYATLSGATFTGQIQAPVVSATTVSAGTLHVGGSDGYIKNNNGNIFISAINGTVVIPSLSSSQFTTVSSNLDSHLASASVHYPSSVIASWVESNFASSVHNHSLSSLSDTQIASIVDGQTIIWSGAANKWVNTTPSEGVTDHGLLTGLLDPNDHPQYASSSLSATISSHTSDGTIHFTSGTVTDWVLLQGYASATQLNNYVLTSTNSSLSTTVSNHIADGTIHYSSGTITTWVNDQGFALASDLNDYVLTSTNSSLSTTVSNHIASASVHYPSSVVTDWVLAQNYASSTQLSNYVLTSTNNALSSLVSNIEASTIGLSSYIAANESSWSSGGVTDHGALTGLGDNDHPQYATLSGATFTGNILAPSVSATALSAATVNGGNLATAVYTSIQDGDTLIWNGSTSAWNNSPRSLSGLTDVLVSATPTVGQVLIWNGTHWDASTSPAGVTDHSLLSNLTANDHPQYASSSLSATISSHTSDGSIHYASTVLTSWANINTFTSFIGGGSEILAIDATGQLILDSADTSIAFTNPDAQTIDITVNEAAVNHNILSGLTTGHPHTQYVLSSTNDALSSTVQSHISSATVHFTVASIDHGSIANLTTGHPHTQYVLSSTNDALSSSYNSHIANSVIHSTLVSKSITVANPSSVEDITMFKSEVGYTISSLNSVVRGSTPSITWTIRKNSDRSATGTEVVTGGTTTTSQTGASTTSLNSASIAAGDYVWLEVTAKSGTVDELHVTIIMNRV